MRIYFVSDIHGSDRCWRKFLAADRFYGADVVVVGGDITGKFLIPIVERDDGTWDVTFMGERRLRSRAEVDDITRRIANQGSYAYEAGEAEVARLESDEAYRMGIFRQLVLDRVARWVAIADEKLAESSVRCFVSGANDDFYEVDDVLRTSRRVEVPDCRLLTLDGGVEFLSVGYGNPTPWHCPRDISEDELGAKIEGLAADLRDPERAIFNLHVPPYGSGLDYAPELDPSLKIVASPSGDVQMRPVGSTAVLAAIERHQPLVSLHGHIHESRGIRRIGRTTVANPGSQYQEGILDGVLVDVDTRKGVARAQLVSG